MLTDFLFGIYKFKTNEPIETLNRLLKLNVKFKDFKQSENTAMFTVSNYESKIKREALKNCEKLDEYGIARLLNKYKGRVGIIIGLIMMLVMLTMSEKFIWDMSFNVKGDVECEEIEALLAENGCKIGAYIPSINLYEICNRLVAQSDNLAWISVNIDGTCANVEAIARSKNERESVQEPSNLLAKCDGIVCNTVTFSGYCLVSVGQEVKKGELLISGISDENSKDFIITYASGQVIAKTMHTLSVSVPLSDTEKVKKSEHLTEISLNIFGKNLKVYRNYGNSPAFCDTIYDRDDNCFVKTEKYRLSLFGKISLPFYVEKTYVSEYEEKEVNRSIEQAKEYAKTLMSKQIASELSSCDITSSKSGYELLGDETKKLVYTVEFDCVENIAKSVPIERNGQK